MTVLVEALRVSAVVLALGESRAIAREVSTHAEMIEVRLGGGGWEGRGEASPMARYGESLASIVAQVEGARPVLGGALSRQALGEILPAGAARNAVDAALWDLEAKQTGRTAEALACMDAARPITTAYTIPIKPPAEAAAVAERERARPLIKVKLGHFADDRARLEAIRGAAPDADLIVDANEGWSLEELRVMAPIARDLGVCLIEQPIHATRDEALAGVDFGVPLCADESCHTRADLAVVTARYQYINIKLDKSGGLTEALALAHAAKAQGLGLMVGCTHGTTLAIAPAFLVAQMCAFCDLDAPLFLADREDNEIGYLGSVLDWSPRRRWGLPQ